MKKMKFHYLIRRLLCLFTVFILFCSPGVKAQDTTLHLGQFTPGGVFDTVFDENGNKYSMGELAIDDGLRGIARGERAPFAALVPATPTCTPGYFRLYLEPGSGMELFATNPTHAQRLAVVCQVLTDLSAFIPSPCTLTGQTVNIDVQPLGSGMFAAMATSYYNVPAVTGGSSGIGDNAVWETINSGVDAYTNVVSPLITTGTGGSSGFFHGMMKINFSLTWNLNLGVAPGTGETDLYTVVLHEMMHALGFQSLINYNGNSQFGTAYQYYSRYDTHLYDNNVTNPLIKTTSGCDLYGWHFNTPAVSTTTISPGGWTGTCSSGYLTSGYTDNTNCPTAVIYSGSFPAAHIPVYTPQCYEPASSLSHFEDECYVPPGYTLFGGTAGPATNNQYFLMANQSVLGPYNPTTNPGAMKRYPTPEERQVLCDIGYRVNTSYGSTANLNFYSYTGGACPGFQCVGVNDGITSLGAYMFSTTPSAPVGINNALGCAGSSLLDNDYLGGPPTVHPAGSFKCMQVLIGGGTLTDGSGSPLGTGPYPWSQSVVYHPASTDFGVQLIRYTPVDAVGQEGNITYVYVYVSDPACVASSCNQVINGNFENAVPGAAGDLYFNPGILHCWSPYTSTPDLYTRGVAGPSGIPLTWTLPSATEVYNFPPAGTNNHFIGFQGVYFGSSSGFSDPEGIQGSFSTPLVIGQNYTISCWAKIANQPAYMYSGLSHHFEIATSPSTAPLIGPVTLTTYAAGVDNLVSFFVPGDGYWHPYTYTFTYSGSAPANRICLYDASFLDPTTGAYAGFHYNYVFVDEVIVKLAADVSTFTLPPSICITSAPINMTPLVSIPGGTFYWYSGSGALISTSSSLDPGLADAASITLGLGGLVNVKYVYMDSHGCTDTVWAQTNIVPGPASYTVTGGGHYCVGGTGVPVGLSGSVFGVSYQLYLGTTPVGSAVTGTGAAISFGLQTAAGTYTVIATSVGCTATMTGSVTITIDPLPNIYAPTGCSYCAGGTGCNITLASSDAGTSYQAWFGGSATGSPVTGSGGSVALGPFTTVGTYTIIATSAAGCTATMGTATVSITPGPAAFTVTGGGHYCAGGTGVTIGLSGSTSGIHYQAYYGGSPIGPMQVGAGTSLTFGPFTGAGTYTIIATDPATGCTTTMTGSATIVIDPLPNIYIPTGCSYCAGGTGCYLSMSGSDAGTSYQAWYGGSAVGSPVTGTGGFIAIGPFTAAGTYTIIATSTAGCTATMGTATITINPLPTLYTVTGGGNYCAGGTGVYVGVSGSSTTVYYQVWCGGSVVGGGLGSGTSTSFGPFTTPGVYTITAIDITTGCTATMTGSVTVGIWPSPSVSVTPASQLLCPGPATMTASASGGTGPYSYSWTPTTGLTPITGPVVNCSGIGSTTTYVVTVTDANGCTATASSTVVIPACGPQWCMGIPGLTLLGVGGVIPGGSYTGNYYIDNPTPTSTYVVHVTGNAFFNSAVVAVAPNVQIVVDPAYQLGLSYTHFYCCDRTKMWNGFVLSSAGGISATMYTAKASMIEDAQTAISISNPVTPGGGGNILFCEGTTFNKNHWGIYINNYTPGAPAVYPFNITNCVFTSRDMTPYYSTGSSLSYPYAWPITNSDLKAPYSPGTSVLPPYNIDNPTGMPGGGPYTMVSCNDGGPADGGIWLNNVGPLTTVPSYPEPGVTVGTDAYAGAQNMFDHMYYGIYCVNSNLISENNVFMHMFSYRTFPLTIYYAGDGIYAVKSTANTLRNNLWIYSPSASGNDNRFYECRIGAEVIGYSDVIGNNTLMYSNHKVGAYDVTNGQYGFYLRGFYRYDDVELNYNTLVNLNTAISLTASSDANTGSLNMNRNYINGTPSDWPAGYTTMGIWASNLVSCGTCFTGYFNINDNQISNVYNGIYGYDFKGKYMFTNDNNVYLIPNALSPGASQAGIQHIQERYNRIIQNYVSGPGIAPYTTKGIVGSSNTSASVLCNNVLNMYDGFYFYGYPNASYWNHNQMQNEYLGYWLNGSVIGPQGNLFTPTDNKWSGPWAGDWQTAVTGTYSAALSPLWVRSGPVTYDPLYNYGGPIWDRYYHPLRLNYASGPLYSCVPVVPIPLAPVLEPLAMLAQYVPGCGDTTVTIDTIIADIPAPGSLANRYWIGQMGVWQGIQTDTTVVDSSAIISEFGRMATESRYAWLTNIETALANGDLRGASVLLGYPIDTLVDTARTASGIIMADGTGADAVVSNYLTFYNVYVDFMTDTLTPSDTAEIIRLAHLCPNNDGWIVYQARAMYTTIFGDYGNYDDACDGPPPPGPGESPRPGKPGSSSDIAVQQYKLFPDPNKGDFTLSQIIPDDNPVTAEILDVTGRSLYKSAISFKQQSANVHIEHAVPGMYLLHITDSKGREYNFKFVIE